MKRFSHGVDETEINSLWIPRDDFKSKYADSYLYNNMCTDPNFPISMSNNQECTLEKTPPW